jgi:predicted dehydrogenase
MNLLAVGLGSIGRRHTKLFSKYFKSIHIADINPSRLDEAKKTIKVNKTFTNYKEAIQKEKYDAILITTPPHLHLEIANAAVKKNINLFIEKPLGMNTKGWKKISDKCKKKKIVNYVAYCHRHINYTQKLKKILDNNEIGKVLNANMRWGSYLPDWHPWEDYRSFYMAKKKQGGGALLDESHGIDLIRYLLGEASGVFAKVEKISDLQITSDDHAFLTLKMKKNILVHINFDLISRFPRVNLEINGSDGSIIWDRVSHEIKIYKAKSKKWKHMNFSKDDFLDMYERQAKHMIKLISNKKIRHSQDIEDSIKTQKIIDKSFESSKKNNFLKI